MGYKYYCPGLLVLLYCFLAIQQAVADDIAPFTSDGCSWFPDGLPEQKTLWQDCCIAHDYAYWKGGSRDERREVDKQLKSCVSSLGQPAVGWLMEFGVRIGGTPVLPTSFRWGYGWPYPRDYRTLTEEELEQVNRQSEERYPNYSGQQVE